MNESTYPLSLLHPSSLPPSSLLSLVVLTFPVTDYRPIVHLICTERRQGVARLFALVFWVFIEEALITPISKG